MLVQILVALFLLRYIFTVENDKELVEFCGVEGTKSRLEFKWRQKKKGQGHETSLKNLFMTKSYPEKKCEKYKFGQKGP